MFPTMGKLVGTTKSLGNKDANDKFFTKPALAEQLVGLLELADFDLIIEPSAGSGAFSGVLNSRHGNVLSFDLIPEADGIQEQDWFLLDKNQFRDHQNILVVGNPPFGNNGSLAHRFIKESLFANQIAFILPKSFKKESIKSRVPQELHLLLEQDIQPNSFTLNGEDYSAPCVFQVWEKRGHLRAVSTPVSSSRFFSFVRQSDSPDFRIQRLGGNAGRASEDTSRSASSNYFIKNSGVLTIEQLISAINSTDFSAATDSTTGPRSLSKTELINILEPVLESLVSAKN